MTGFPEFTDAQMQRVWTITLPLS